MWHGSVDVGHARATCWHCRTAGDSPGPHSLGCWGCPCDLGQWALEHTHDSDECKVWADGLVAKCEDVGHECQIVFDGLDINGDAWNKCVTHGELVLGDAPHCEGFRP